LHLRLEYKCNLASFEKKAIITNLLLAYMLICASTSKKKQIVVTAPACLYGSLATTIARELLLYFLLANMIWNLGILRE